MNALIHPFAILYLIVALVTQAAAQSDFADERRYQDCMVQAQKTPIVAWTKRSNGVLKGWSTSPALPCRIPVWNRTF